MAFKDWLRALGSFKSWLSGIGFGARPAETFAIGTQMAQANAAQQRHAEVQGSFPSPMANLRYSNLEGRAWRWAKSPTDGAIEAIVADFAGLDPAQRSALRDSLTMDDFYTLLTFARSCALSTLRSGEPAKIEPAFMAIAMIERERIDWRDLLVANRLLRYAGQRQGVSVKNFVGRAIKLAEPQTAEALRQDSSGQIDLAESCGYREVSTSEGVALFRTGYEPYSPKADLTGIAFDIAVALEGNGYKVEDIMTATDLPLTWLGSRDGSAIAEVVRRFSGCILINGVPGADPEPVSSGQSLLVFLAEAASEADAKAVAAAAENSTDSLRTQIGVASGRLCAVIIQHSWMANTPPVENKHALERLRGLVERLLM
jgi:hypothetical protein